MLLADPKLVSFFKHQVGLEDDVEWKKNACIGQSCKVAKLEGPNPFQYPSVFVDNFTLFEVERVARVLSWHAHKRLIKEGRMVDIFFELEESVERGSKELRVSQSVGYIGVLLLRTHWNVILVAFAVIVVVGDWTVEPLSLPFSSVLEGGGHVPRRVGDKAVFIAEGPNLFIVDIPSREAKVR